MFNNREHIRIINPDSIILLLIVSLGLLIYNSSFNKSTESKKKLIYEVSVTSEDFDLVPPIRLQVYQKTWISKKDNFKLLSFYRNMFLEDKKTDQKISLLQDIRENSQDIPIYIFRHHLFPSEEEGVPVLS